MIPAVRHTLHKVTQILGIYFIGNLITILTRFQFQPDALHEVAVKHLGVSSAGSRGALRADHVSRDEAGLRELLRTGCLRAALNLTTELINAAGQG